LLKIHSSLKDVQVPNDVHSWTFMARARATASAGDFLGGGSGGNFPPLKLVFPCRNW